MHDVYTSQCNRVLTNKINNSNTRTVVVVRSYIYKGREKGKKKIIYSTQQTSSQFNANVSILYIRTLHTTEASSLS